MKILDESFSYYFVLENLTRIVSFIVNLAGVGGVIFEGASYRAMGVTGGILFGTGFTCIGIFGHQLWQLFLFNGITGNSVFRRFRPNLDVYF